MPFEFLLFVLVLVLAIGGQLLSIVLSILAFVHARRARHLGDRVERLENLVRDRSPTSVSERPETVAAVDPATAKARDSDPSEQAGDDRPRPSERVRPSIDWEKFVGQRALGWAAILLLFLAAGFFLRYAYDNDWIGPLGRVAISALIGCALTVGGQRYAVRGWKIFSQTLTGAGVVVLYLASYSAFEFYQLLPPQHAGIFLALIIVESMILAVIYDSVAIGIIAVLGGLVTPLLMQTDRDSYVALFSYLVLLDLGTMVVLILRRWPAIGSLVLLGTHGLFWSWYATNYHPEKLVWALGFQLAVLFVFLAYTVFEQLVRKQPESWEGLTRVMLTPALAFLALFVLLKPDYQVWMGSLAVLMALMYAALGRVTLTLRPQDRRLLLTFLAVSIGFLALAFPIQADARWIALGWAATGLALWWFGQRVTAPALRLMAAALMGSAAVRVIFFDVQRGISEPFWPLLNTFAFPSSCVAVCLLAATFLTRPFLGRLGAWEKRGVAAITVTGVLLLWLVLTVDCYSFFDAQSRQPGVDRSQMRWLGQLCVSVLWAVYASIILAVGFRLRRAPLRWLAIGGYAITVLKVLMFDMASLEQFYRILAFFILAIVLGLATRAYQRLESPGSQTANERKIP